MTFTFFVSDFYTMAQQSTLSLKVQQSLDTDIAIIGGGPAGAICSLNLCRNNISHIIIDGQDFPRDKACADIITSNAIRTLNRLEMGLVEEMRDMGELLPIYGTKLHIDGHELDVPYKELDGKEEVPSCYSVTRSALDYRLWKRIGSFLCADRMAGTYISEVKRSGEKFSLKSKDGTEIGCKLLIVATGSQSYLTEQLIGEQVDDRHYALGLRAYYKDIRDVSSTHCELYLNKDIMPGGFYIAPMRNGLYNVNVVVRKDKVKKDGLKLRELLEDVISQNPALRNKFRDAKRFGEVQGSGLMLGTKKLACSGDHFILCGDAAGLIDLISANGIPQAMISGELAAKHALARLKENDFSTARLHAYDTELHARIKSDLAVGKLLSPLLSYRWFCNVTHDVVKGLSDGKALQRLLYSDHPKRDFVKSLFNR